MREKVLIVDDEKDIVKMLAYNLSKEGFRVVTASDGLDALACASAQHPDIILLDVMLPSVDGFEVCRRLKQNQVTTRIPILMLSAKGQESDKVVGLELGADDYITKPFSPREVVARIRAVLRRMKAGSAPEDIIRAGTLAIDLARIQVTSKQETVELTAKEFELLKTLALARGRVLSRDYLLDTIWGYAHAIEMQTRTVDVHIRSLRKKLGGDSRHIVTVKNYGYRFHGGE